MIGHGMWFGPGWGVLAGLVSVAFWVLVVIAIVALVRRRPGVGGTGATSAVRVLEERYARGEISREEFLERRAVLLGEERRS